VGKTCSSRMGRGALGKLAHCWEFRGVVGGGRALEEGGHWRLEGRAGRVILGFGGCAEE